MATILVVDDLEANVKLLEAKLTNEYYDVSSARSGKEALDILDKTPDLFDVILLDVMMPEIDGFEVCRRIKANPKIAHIPVVMVTALQDIENRIEGLRAGADDFLTKPIVDLALFARIRSLVRLKEIMDEFRVRGQQEYEEGNINKISSIDISHANILVIDDDFTQSDFLKSKLGRITKNIEIVSKTNIDLDPFLSSGMDIIVISTQLLDSDGLRICSKLKNNPKAKNVPIILLVEDEDYETLAKGLDLGASDYMLTPLDETEITVRVSAQVRRKRYQDALKENLQQNLSLASTDHLTGLYNRHYFDNHANNLLTKAMPGTVGFIMSDLDNFKMVNDTYGHLIGDILLKSVALAIKEHIRPMDVVARFGGEEFVVLLENVNKEDLLIVAERLRAKVEEKVHYSDPATNLVLKKTISIGCSLYKENDTLEMLTKRADDGLYMAKERGKNQVVFQE